MFVLGARDADESLQDSDKEREVLRQRKSCNNNNNKIKKKEMLR